LSALWSAAQHNLTFAMTGINSRAKVLCDEFRPEVPMSHDRAIVRTELERLDGVTKAWFEWIHEKNELSQALVVEVNFDTDPSSLHFRQRVINAIVDTVKAALDEDTTMDVQRLRIVPPP
jgi:hypothetical protein